MAEVVPSSILAGKRKRPSINYAELDGPDFTDIEEISDSGLSDGEGDDGRAAFDPRSPNKRKLKKRSPAKRAKTATAKPKKAKKPFPFMSLPPELREQVYQYALVDPEAVKIANCKKALRRTVRRMSVFVTTGRYGHRQVDDTETVKAALSPNLLATSKQVYNEAIGYLYKQPFIMQNTLSLFTFLATITPATRLLINDITVKEWGDGRGIYKAMNFAAFTLLAGCTNLKSLTFDCWAHGWYRPATVAGDIYRAGHFWIEAYGVVKGDKAAAAEIITIHAPGYTQGSQDREQWHADFRAALRKFVK